MREMVAFLVTLLVAAAMAHAQVTTTTQVPSCYWSSEPGVCVPSLINMLAPSLPPGNAFRRAFLMALDRSERCIQHKDTRACAGDSSTRCFWQRASQPAGGQGGICLGADYAEMIAFEASGFAIDAATIPAAMTCPGTRASEFFSCFSHPAPGMPYCSKAHTHCSCCCCCCCWCVTHTAAAAVAAGV